MKTPGQVVPAQKQALGHQVLMLGGEMVIGLDLLLGLGVDFLHVLADDRRKVADPNAPAGESERVMDEDGESPPGQLVGPAQAAVIVVAMLLHHRMDLVADLGDLAPAEILVAAMIVQTQHGGESAACAGWLQKDGFGRRSIRKLPAQVLDMQPVVDKLVLKLGFGTPPSPAGASRHAAARAPVPPRVDLAGLKSRLTKRQPRRTRTRQTRRPRAIGSNHVRIHPIVSRFRMK